MAFRPGPRRDPDPSAAAGACAPAGRRDLRHGLGTFAGAKAGVRLWLLVIGTARSLALAAGWMACGAVAMQPGPVAATAGAALTVALFCWLYVARPMRAGDRRLCAALRLRSPRRRAWPVLLLLACWLLLLGSPPPASWRHLGPGEVAASTHLVPLTIVAVLLVPLVEGFFLRGFIQQRLRRAVGIVPALLLTSLLAALPPRPPHGAGALMASGLAYGAAVHATRSVWSGVVLHISGNAGAMAALWRSAPPPASAPPTRLATTSR